MPKQLEPRLVEILQKYHPEPKKAVWDCHGTFVIYHKAVEQIAAAAGVKFFPPEVIVRDQASKHVAILVVGQLGDKEEWSIGEAAPYNNKNGYPFAMAEKRAKDRVVLKLIGLHGDIYSEDEADDLKPQKREPEPREPVAKPEPTPAASTVNADELIAAIENIDENTELFAWGRENAATISKLPDATQARVRQTYMKRREALTHAEAAE